jgi:1-acyl-sn-glycerol-3-phosphate acyltransferase
MIKKIKGIGNIPYNDTFILVSNHQRRVDSLYVFYPILKKLNKKMHVITTPTWWFLGNAICRKWAACIPLFSKEQAYQESKELIKSGEIVGIFPEGHLKAKDKNPRTGAVRLAIETNTPILPVGLKSSYLPFSSALNIGKLIYPKKSRNIGKQTADIMKKVYGLRDSA